MAPSHSKGFFTENWALTLALGVGGVAAIPTLVGTLRVWSSGTKSNDPQNGIASPRRRMIRPSPEIVQCPHCHIQNFAIDESCVGCGQSLTVTIGPRPRLRRVNLQTVMILIGVIAVCLAGLRENVVVCLLLAGVLIPTTLRALLMIEERKADGRPMVWPQQLEAFSTSCLVSLVIAISAILAFITCFPIGLMTLDLGRNAGSGGIMVAFLAGGTSAIFVIYSLGKRLWPRKD